MNKLFTEISIGSYELSHRVVLAPLTRLRSEQGDIPGKLMAEYYSQRTSDRGLLITEATSVLQNGNAYIGAPGIYDDSQIAGWKRVTDAVHNKGGRIFLQVWHSGRQSHPDIIGETPVAPSAIPSEEFVVARYGEVKSAMPRALALDELPFYVEAFANAAERAQKAGFDGVELHNANGYLPDQFLQDGSNHRQDAYGGPIENRARFPLEVVEALVNVWGGDRVGVRISPSGKYGTMSDSNPAETFGYFVTQLNRFNLAYLHIIEPRIRGYLDLEENVPPVASEMLRKTFKGPIIAAGGFNKDSAEAILQAGHADLVAFGRHFIANPDLPERFRLNLPLNQYDRDTFYGGNAHGYTDYPFYSEHNLTV